MLARVLEALGDSDPIEVKARERELHQQLRSMSDNKPQIHAIWVQGPDGRPLLTDRELHPTADRSVSGMDYFEWHRTRPDGIHLSEPMVDPADGKAFFEMSRGRYGPGGSFAGVVSVGLVPRHFEQFHSDLAADEPGLAITMLRDDGIIYTRWPQLQNAPAARLHEETQARRRVEEALLQAQKLEALRRLTGGVAHDLNNALMVISNNLFLLKRKHPETSGPHTDSSGRAVGSATKLTRQLLAFSRKQALVPEYMVLQERLPTLRDLLGPVLGSQVQFALQVAPDVQPILADAAEFELALINLAINARDAMPQGGSFTIGARNVAAGELPPLLTGPMVVVEASDTGNGIEPETLSKVFEPFFTTKPIGEGTGLGLSQVYGLCQRAGGTATIVSQPGRGTQVRLFFPAAPVRPEGTVNARPLAQRQLGKKLLLVEDNDDVAAALQPVLEAMGCTVLRLNRALAARDWLASKGELPDLLLTDVVMPGDLDGVALAEYARTHFPSLKIIVTTGYAEQIETIARMGFEIVPKPCSAEMLAEAIERVCGAPPERVP